MPQFGAPPPPGYPPPPPPAAKRNGGRIALIIGLVAVLLLCPCLGLTGWAVWRATGDGDSSPTVATSAEPTEEAAEEPSTAPSSVEPDPTKEPDEFAPGACVVNDGTDEDAELRAVPCGPETYEVLLRIPETTDGQRCRTLSPTSTANYVHDNPVDIFDYVLCLRKHTR